MRRLLQDQLPQLAARPLVPGPTGWDNAHWLLGGDLAVRLPRRRSAVRLVVHEVTWLPRLAPALPLPVPAPVHVGEPGEDWPWPWSVIPWFEGERADLAYPPAGAEEHAVALGRFLAALHVPAPAEAPHNPHRSITLAQRAARTGEALTTLGARDVLDAEDLAALRRVWDAGVAAPVHAGPPRWIHGDLHPGNQLVRDGRLSAVVDWGDVAAGDPAVDLATAWWSLPLGAHGAFADAYGGIDGATWARAAAWAAAIAAYLLKEGPAAGDPALVGMARRATARLRAAG